MKSKLKASPVWSRTIETLRHSLKLSQAELGHRLETSAMAAWPSGNG
jgi:DNA-binding transcriptional regulator YiaG